MSYMVMATKYIQIKTSRMHSEVLPANAFHRQYTAPSFDNISTSHTFIILIVGSESDR